mmetsp:Transcript_2553/g.5690  ORF Transcript_2553/g.5690 Transcript_2553/m.5690 type:complete len:134 (-) Transcript_2553:818-1219(-)
MCSPSLAHSLSHYFATADAATPPDATPEPSGMMETGRVGPDEAPFTAVEDESGPRAEDGDGAGDALAFGLFFLLYQLRNSNEPNTAMVAAHWASVMLWLKRMFDSSTDSSWRMVIMVAYASAPKVLMVCVMAN